MTLNIGVLDRTRKRAIAIFLILLVETKRSSDMVLVGRTHGSLLKDDSSLVLWLALVD
jgi:hypothetical protein